MVQEYLNQLPNGDTNEERIHSRLHIMTPCEVERKYHEHHAKGESTDEALA